MTHSLPDRTAATNCAPVAAIGALLLFQILSVPTASAATVTTVWTGEVTEVTVAFGVSDGTQARRPSALDETLLDELLRLVEVGDEVSYRVTFSTTAPGIFSNPTLGRLTGDYPTAVSGFELHAGDLSISGLGGSAAVGKELRPGFVDSIRLEHDQANLNDSGLMDANFSFGLVRMLEVGALPGTSTSLDDAVQALERFGATRADADGFFQFSRGATPGVDDLAGLAFDVSNIEVAVVPLPAAGVLLAPALALLALFGRRTRPGWRRALTSDAERGQPPLAKR